MTNPKGPYPGRQLFLGLTLEKKICAAYLVTGRSTESRERKAVIFGNAVRIGPLGNTPYDPLRHYTAIKYDESGIAAVSNGIQTEAVYELYKLLVNVNSPLATDYLIKVMEGANAEPDSYHTPRISGIAVAAKSPILIVCIKTFDKPAAAVRIEPQAGFMTGISTYRGEFENPQATDPSSELPRLNFGGKTAAELSKYLYDISEAKYKGEDIRVCAVGLIYNSDKRDWETAIMNARE
jgi:IMP cyclohydrolase